MGDAETDEECGYPDLVRTNLSIRFAMPDHVIFGLDGLPHVMGACADDLYEAPIGELTGTPPPRGIALFPSACALALDAGRKADGLGHAPLEQQVEQCDRQTG